ncbi:MAG: hypothetical protein ACTTIX_09140, partial [Peptoanaerobacter stomatis]
FFIHKLSNAAKVINKGHLRGFQPTKCPLRPTFLYRTHVLVIKRLFFLAIYYLLYSYLLYLDIQSFNTPYLDD